MCAKQNIGEKAAKAKTFLSKCLDMRRSLKLFHRLSDPFRLSDEQASSWTAWNWSVQQPGCSCGLPGFWFLPPQHSSYNPRPVLLRHLHRLHPVQPNVHTGSTALSKKSCVNECIHAGLWVLVGFVVWEELWRWKTSGWMSSTVSCNWERQGAGRNGNVFGYWDSQNESGFGSEALCVSICPCAPSFLSPPLKTIHEALLRAVCLLLSSVPCLFPSCHSVFSLSPLVAAPPPAASDISDVSQQEENPILNVNCNLLIQINESWLDNQ